MKKNSITSTTTVCQTQEVVTSDIDGEVVMMSIAKGNYYGMDAIGSRIWELMAHPIKVKDLVKLLLEEFKVDYQTCEKDVLKFLNELHDDNIIALH